MMIKEFSFGIIPFKKTEEGILVLLTLHKGGKHWGFPKGHPESDETKIETATRELKEETGLDIESLLLDEPYEETYTFYKFHEKVQKTVSYYPAFVTGKIKLQPEEIIDARWYPIHDATRHMTFKEARVIFEKAVELL